MRRFLLPVDPLLPSGPAGSNDPANPAPPRGRANPAPPRGRSRARARRTQGVRSTSAGDTPPHLGTPESDTPSHSGDEPDAEPGGICSPTVFAQSSSEDSDTQTPAGAGSEAQPSAASAAAAAPTAKASSQQTVYQRAENSYQPAASLVQVVQDSPSPARRQSSPQRRQASRNPAGAGGPGVPAGAGSQQEPKDRTEPTWKPYVAPKWGADRPAEESPDRDPPPLGRIGIVGSNWGGHRRKSDLTRQFMSSATIQIAIEADERHMEKMTEQFGIFHPEDAAPVVIWQQRHLRLSQSLEKNWAGNSRASWACKIAAVTLEAVRPPTDRRLTLTVAGIHVNNWFARNRTTKIREILVEAEQWLQSHNVDVLYGDFNGCADSVGGAQPAVVEMLPPERWHRPPEGLLLFGQARQWAAEGTCVTGFALSADSKLLMTEHGQWDIQPEQLSLGKADTGWHLPSYMRLRPAEVSSGRRMRSEAGADKRKARKRKQQQDRCRLEPNPKWRSKTRTDHAPEQAAYGGGAGSSDPWTDWHTAAEHTTSHQRPPPQQVQPANADQPEVRAAGVADATEWHESTWTAPERWASPERWWSRSEWAEWKQHRADTQSQQWQWYKDCYHAQLISFIELVISWDCREASRGGQELLKRPSTACSYFHGCTRYPLYVSTRPSSPPPSQSRSPAYTIPLEDLPDQEVKVSHTQQRDFNASGSRMLSSRSTLCTSMQCIPYPDMEHKFAFSSLEAVLMHLPYSDSGSHWAPRRAALSSLTARHRGCSRETNGTKESNSRVEMPTLRQSKHASIYAMSRMSIRKTSTRHGAAPDPNPRQSCWPCAARRCGSAGSPTCSGSACCCWARRCEACSCWTGPCPAPPASPARECSPSLASWIRRSDYRCLYDTHSHSGQSRSTVATSATATTRCPPPASSWTTTTNRRGRGGRRSQNKTWKKRPNQSTKNHKQNQRETILCKEKSTKEKSRSSTMQKLAMVLHWKVCKKFHPARRAA